MVHSQGQQQSQQAKQRNERGDRFRLSAGRVSAPHLPHLVILLSQRVRHVLVSEMVFVLNTFRPLLLHNTATWHSRKEGLQTGFILSRYNSALGLDLSCTTIQQVVKSALDYLFRFIQSAACSRLT